MSTFLLNPSDIATSGMAYSGGRRKARFSRSNQSSSYTLTLEHMPTGVKVQGSIPQGSYSRKEMSTRKAALFQQLYTALEQAVAKVLRVPGR